MDGKDFLSVAWELKGGHPGEERTFEPRPDQVRSSISRSYYAFLLTCRNWLANYGIRIKKNREEHGTHAVVLGCMLVSPKTDARLCARKLRKVRDSRARADYEMDDLTMEDKGVADTTYEMASLQIKSIGETTLDEAQVGLFHAAIKRSDYFNSVRLDPIEEKRC